MKCTRRDFIHAGCTIAAASLVPSIVDKAEARLLYGTPAPPISFNGGLSQIQSTFLQTAGDYPFINYMLTGQAWQCNNDNSLVDPAVIGANGYLSALTGSASGGVYTVFFIPAQSAKPGNMVITWDSAGGTTSIGLGPFTQTFVGGSTSTSLATGRYVFSTTEQRIVIGQVSLGVSNMRCYNINDEPALLAGEVFGAMFKSLLLAAKPGVIRFMDWLNANGTNLSTWSTRRGQAFYSYFADEWRPSLYAGPTLGTGTAYTISFGSGGPVDKMTIHTTINVTSGASPTLNLNGTGAVALKGNNGNALNVGDLPAGIHLTLVYDASLGWLASQGGLTGNVPPELCIQLCKEIGAHPYMVTPMLACDPVTDWIPQLAAYIQAAPGCSWMIPRFEPPNETWNSYSGFLSTPYAINKSFADYAITDNPPMQWYGKALSNLGQQVATAYGVIEANVHTQTKYQMLCGVQSATFASTSNSNPRLNASNWVAHGGSAASNWVTHVCVTTYVNPVEGNTLEEFNDALSFQSLGGIGNPTALALVTAYTNNNDVAGLSTSYSAWQAWGAAFGVLNLTSYEGGWSPDYAQVNGANSQVLTGITAATNASPCVITLDPTTTTLFGSAPQSGLCATVGAYVKLFWPTGIWATAFQGQVAQITVIDGNNITLALNASTLGAAFSNVGGGDASCSYLGTDDTQQNASSVVNAYRQASKSVASQQSILATNYANFVANPYTTFPSCYDLSSPSNVNGTEGAGSVWGVFDPDIYATPSPQWLGILAFNA